MNKGRITAYAEICPVCGEQHTTFVSETGCDECGYPRGKDWRTDEIDLETRVVIRTVVPAQVKE